MSEEPKDIYGLESGLGRAEQPASESGSEAAAGAAGASPRVGKPLGSSPRIEPSPDVEPLALEDEVPLSQRPIKELDVCPNCGALLGGSGEILCMRCGFDLKTMRTLEVQTGEVEVSAHSEEDAAATKPLALEGRGGFMLPLIVAGVIGGVLIVCYALGVRGLFLPNPETDPNFGQRMLGMLQMLVRSALLTGCGIGALAFLAFLNSQRLGDLRLAAARMLAIVAATQFITLMNFAGNATEFTIESILQAGCFAGLSLLLFDIKPKDVPTLLGATVILYVFVQLGAWVITVLAG